MAKYVKVNTFEHDWKINEFRLVAASPTFWIEIEENSLLKWSFTFREGKIHHSFFGMIEQSACNLAALYAKVSSQLVSKAGIVLVDYEGSIMSLLHRLAMDEGCFGTYNFVTVKNFEQHIITDLDESDATCEDFFIKCKVEFFRKAMDISEIENDSTKLSRMFNEELFSDCTLKSAEGMEFKIHKAVLAAESSVFESMFSNETDEDDNEDEFPKLGEDRKVLKEVFRYIYTREVVGLEALAEPLLVAANKYLVEGLKGICAAEILGQIKIENVLRLVVFANQHNCSEVVEYAAQFIASNLRAVRATEDWDSFNSNGSHGDLRNKIFDFLLIDVENLKTSLTVDGKAK